MADMGEAKFAPLADFNGFDGGKSVNLLDFFIEFEAALIKELDVFILYFSDFFFVPGPFGIAAPLLPPLPVDFFSLVQQLFYSIQVFVEEVHFLFELFHHFTFLLYVDRPAHLLHQPHLEEGINQLQCVIKYGLLFMISIFLLLVGTLLLLCAGSYYSQINLFLINLVLTVLHLHLFNQNMQIHRNSQLYIAQTCIQIFSNAPHPPFLLFYPIFSHHILYIHNLYSPHLYNPHCYNLICMNDITLKDVINGGVFAVFGLAFLYKGWCIREENRKIKVLQSWKTKIKDVNELKAMKEGEGIFKVQIARSPTLQIKKQIRYNEYFVCEPSDILIVNQSQKKYQTTDKIYVKDNNKTLEVNGCGKLIGDVFKIDRSHSIENYGFIKQVYGFCCWTLEKVLTYLFKKKKNLYHVDPNRKPVIKGPVIGSLTYLVTLIPDSFVLLKCKVENGQIMGELIAESKNQIVEYYNSQVHRQYLLLFILFSVTLFSGKMLFKSIKRWLNINILKKGIIGRKLYNLEEVGEGKECIICYTNCRNIIFFDCRHMAMCYECSQNYKEGSCPICKNDIDRIKVLYEK